MKPVTPILISLAMLATTAVGTPAMAADGATLYKTKTCFTCHGADGNTPIMDAYPKIAGQSAAYSLQQMKDIKSGARANGLSAAMKGVMHLVNDDEMKVLADYIATM